MLHSIVSSDASSSNNHSSSSISSNLFSSSSSSLSLENKENSRAALSEVALMDDVSPQPQSKKRKKILGSVSINEQIQQKICKITTDYGKGTGFFVNDEKGILLTNFHLVGALLPPKCSISDPEVFALLLATGYVERGSRLTKKVMSLSLESDIHFTIEEPINVPIIITDQSRESEIKKIKEIKVTVDAKLVDSLEKKYDGFKSKLLETLKPYTYVREPTILSHIIDVEINGEILGGEIYFPPGSSPEDKGKLLENYALFDTLPVKISHFSDGASFDEKGRFLNTGNAINFLPSDAVPPRIGEVIYFGGYSLTQEEYTFSKGMISSVSRKGSRELIVIEAPIAPGNSGSPVFLKRGNKIYLIGVINSEIALISEEMLQVREDLRVLGEGMTYGNSIRKIGFVSTFRELTEMLLSNLSTGKGKAIVLRNLDQLYNLELDAKSELASLPLEFLVPQKKRDLQKKVKLFEYINEKRLTRLTVEDMRQYLNDHIDEATRQIIFSAVNIKLLGDEDHIVFPAHKAPADTEEKDISDEKIIVKNVSDRKEVDIRKKMIRDFYGYVVLSSQQKLADAQYDFIAGRNISICAKDWVTQKFFDDHIGAENRARTEEKADRVAKKREQISISTMIPLSELSMLSQEVEERQGFYAEAEQKARAESKTLGKPLHGLYFFTRNPHQLIIRSKNEGDKRQRSSFFYSVIRKGPSEAKPEEGSPKYYMHHFEGIQPKEWEQVRVPEKERGEQVVHYTTYTPRR